MKAEQAREMAAQIEFNFEDIRQKCDNYIEQTREKAKQILLEAHEEGKRIHQKSFEEGQAAGKKQGLVDADAHIKQQATQIADAGVKAELNRLSPAIESALEQLRQEQQQCLVRWESEAIHLAVAIAEKISREQVVKNPQLVIDRVIELLRLTVGETNIRIRLHPDDAKAITEAGIVLENNSSDTSKQNTQILPDEALLPGDCVVETKHGTLDASFDEQLKRIASELCY